MYVFWYTVVVCSDLSREFQGTKQFAPGAPPHRPGLEYEEKTVATDTKQDKKEVSKEAGWRDLPIGGILKEAGSAEKYLSGDWRIERPIWNSEKCISCLVCWAYCPDSSIIVNEEGKMTGIDLDHCKGCGICAEECPPKVKAIEMVPEADFRGK